MKRWQLSFLAAAVAGCGLINSHTLSADYAFDAQHYGADLGADTGNKMPIVDCDPAAKPDPCAQLQFPDKLYGQCQSDTRQCAAVADVSLAYTVDYRTAQTQLPTPVVQYSIDHVSIKKIAYWLMQNSLNVGVPAIDLYVAPMAANDWTDPKAEKIGSIAALPPGMNNCLDNADKAGDSAAEGSAVCDVPLSDAGEAVLAGYVKAYKTTPFKLIAYTRIVAHGGDPVPAGMLAFGLRPTVTFSLLSN